MRLLMKLLMRLQISEPAGSRRSQGRPEEDGLLSVRESDDSDGQISIVQDEPLALDLGSRWRRTVFAEYKC